MAVLDLLQRNFVGGVIPESMEARIDTELYTSSLREADNFAIQPQGSLRKRNGLDFVWSSEEPNLTSVRWIPFRLADGRTLSLLLTPNVIYAFLNGGIVVGLDEEDRDLFPARVEIDNWAEHTLTDPQTNIRYVQIGDSIYFTRQSKKRYAVLKVIPVETGEVNPLTKRKIFKLKFE